LVRGVVEGIAPDIVSQFPSVVAGKGEESWGGGEVGQTCLPLTLDYYGGGRLKCIDQSRCLEHGARDSAIVSWKEHAWAQDSLINSALTRGMRNSPPACAALSSAFGETTEGRGDRSQRILHRSTRGMGGFVDEIWGGVGNVVCCLSADNSELFSGYKSHRISK